MKARLNRFKRGFPLKVSSLLLLGLLLLASPGCETTSSTQPISVSKIHLPAAADKVLVVDRHHFAYDLWYSSSRRDETLCGAEMKRRPIQLRIAQYIDAKSLDMGVEFAAPFHSHLPEELGYLQFQFHGKPLSMSIAQKQPVEKPEQLDAETVRNLAYQTGVDLLLSIEWISLRESLVEEVAGSEAVRGGTSVTYELRSVKSSKIEASCGFRLYDGKSGELLDQSTYSHTQLNKYREPIDCSTLLATESRKALAQCFKQLLRNLERLPN